MLSFSSISQEAISSLPDIIITPAGAFLITLGRMAHPFEGSIAPIFPDPDLGEVTIVGQQVQLFKQDYIQPIVGTVITDSQDSTASQGTVLQPPIGNMIIVGQTPIPVRGNVVQSDSDSISFDSESSLLTFEYFIQPSSGFSITIGRLAHPFEGITVIPTFCEPDAGQLLLEQQQNSIQEQNYIQPLVATITIGQQTTEIFQQNYIEPSTSIVEIDGYLTHRYSRNLAPLIAYGLGVNGSPMIQHYVYIADQEYKRIPTGILQLTGQSPITFIRVHTRNLAPLIAYGLGINASPMIQNWVYISDELQLVVHKGAINFVGQAPTVVISGIQPPIVIPTASVSGGSIAMGPGEIWNFYKPVSNSPRYLTPYQLHNKRKAKHVKIVVSINGETTEKYVVVTLPKTRILLKKIDIRVSPYAVTASQIHKVRGIKVAVVKETTSATFIRRKASSDKPRLNQ